MAIFQETHPLPMDPIAKRPLTLNDIEFLKKLQYEHNTQDSMGNRNPRFWVIKESQKTYVNRDNCYDYVTITNEQDLGFEIWNLDTHKHRRRFLRTHSGNHRRYGGNVKQNRQR